MASVAARMSVLRGRPATPWESAAPAAPTPSPSDRSNNARHPADKSDAVPPSASLLAIAASPVTLNHATGATLPTLGQALRLNAGEHCLDVERRAITYWPERNWSRPGAFSLT